MEKVRLNNGVEMPILGFGVFQVTDGSECVRSVMDAIHNELLLSIEKKHNKSVAHVILRWLTQRGIIAIPSIRKERMEENLPNLDFQLSEGNVQAIKTLDTNASLFFDHRDRPW